MQTRSIQYSRPLTQAFFAGATHADLKWTINYLMELLEIPEKKVEEPQIVSDGKYSARINKLLSIPKIKLEQEDIEDDERLQSILER